jgi:hypothetical protein
MRRYPLKFLIANAKPATSDYAFGEKSGGYIISKPMPLINRWGAKLAIGNRVLMTRPRGDPVTGVIVRFETKGEFARAYGPRVILDCSMSGSIDDCRIPLGPSTNP